MTEQCKSTEQGKSTEQLARLVSAKRQVLKIVVQLSERQVEMIECGQMEDLMKLLAAKQTVLAQLQSLERELAPYRDDDPETRAWASPAARAACQAQATEANALIGRSLELERTAEAAMVARRDAAEQSLAAFQAAADARTAYGPLLAPPIAGLQMEG
jgi:hypothetical protein